MVAIFSKERPPNHSAITQPAQAWMSPPSGSVVPKPSTVSQTTHFTTKMAKDHWTSARGKAVHHRPCSAMMIACALLRASISAAIALAARSAACAPSVFVASSLAL